ncbi:DNA primase [Agrococcus sp. SL85]|uniref:DNA primase n=1 Tax=Agrococcus sp. SL85 TaxID=2995141 RepID=UPI00226CD2C3|nr:DNA primase [Agrococcus sp. SL85]WAC65727.1 DNA primase [Agrococcus sp. SL85]
MAGRILRADIDEVRARVSIVDVVGAHVTLKTAGVGSMKGLCPFHDERTPSFHVRPAVGRYHCFGCGEDGDVFQFVMAMDHTSFQETVERFAAQIGFTLRYEDGKPQEETSGRLRLLEASKAAEAYFREQLLTPQAALGQRFLGERGFDLAAAERFGVGFAPQSFDALRSHLKGRGFSDQELLGAGLLSEGQRGPYDRFRGRLVWPIRDVAGATIGFGARRLSDDDKGPKYLNSPETPIFRKSQVLYGLDLAKRDIARSHEAVVVEGYTDVMACHLAGVPTAVATCGTAFGVDHIKVLRRVLGDVSTSDTRALGRVVFTFDPDEAGQQAAARTFAEEQRFAAQTFVAVAPGGLDPCDLRLERGDDAVRKLVQQRRPLFEFMLRRIVAEHDLETVEGRVAAMRRAAPVLVSIRDRALADGYVRTVAGWLGVSPDEVRRAVRQATPRQAQGGAQEAAPAHPPADVALRQLERDPASRLERDAIAAILQQPAVVGRELAVRGAVAYVANPSLAIVRDGVLASLDAIEAPDFSERVAEAVPAEIVPLVRTLAMTPIPQSTKGVTAYVRGIVGSLVDRDILRRKAELLGSLQRLGGGDPEGSKRLQEQLVELERERRTLRQE